MSLYIERTISAGKERSLGESMAVMEYFRCGSSVDAVMEKHRYDFPLSESGLHHVLERYGVVKAAGPHSSLSESLFILKLLEKYRVPLESLYKGLPRDVKTSLSTMHRIVRAIEKGIVNRYGVALIVTPERSPDVILVANDFSVRRPELGHPGDLSLPMGFARKSEPADKSILRVMQQEMYTSNVVDGTMPLYLVPQNPEPLFYINVADISVAVHKIVVPDESLQFSSFKLQEHRFVPASELVMMDPMHEHVRPGVVEMATLYLEQLYRPDEIETQYYVSELNQSLVAGALAV